jgi:hypothetical protein
MRKSGKEIAECGDLNEQKAWLIDASPREIEQFMHRIALVPNCAEERLSRVALDIRIAEDAEIYTRRIVRLTWALVILTAALLFYTVVIYQDAHKQIQCDTLKQDGNPKHP